MFEGVVSQVLVGYLGLYIKCIQKEQLKIDIWNGEILLEKVELILEAFDYLQLPFTLKNGRVGKWSIRIPWKKLVEFGIYQKRELAGKMAKLNAVELAKFSKSVSGDPSSLRS
ncbi:hypothetical protein J5N97_025067 [Dioscorea zingiberensis]|uniref:Chorein N-terminal domain-containing protein n=1 Tax=Dioscorea zingiberensis TaxID=325984 RepID=A0A9D5C862_9LILI|nr:hypothetical protein J5N97_025067 [Dioscorea zingiberensis]